MVVLITGANGFLGSHLLDQSQKLGYKTIGLVRPGSDVSDVQRGNEVVTTDYSEDSLKGVLYHIKDKFGPIDLFIHNAGATRAKTNHGFTEVNVYLTQRLLKLLETDKLLSTSGKFIYISSMASKGPVGAGGAVSEYGRSKLEAEKLVMASGLSYNIFRPTAIYGPRDIQFLRLIKAVKKGIYPAVASRQKMTLIHAADAAGNILSCSLALEEKVVPLEDGNVYSHDQFKKAIENALGRKSINLRIPRNLAGFFIGINEKIAHFFHIHPSMTVEKFLEITRDWDHDHQKVHQQFGLHMKFDLNEGMADTVRYYEKNNLI